MITSLRRRSPNAAQTTDPPARSTDRYEGCLQGVGNGHALGWCWEPAAPNDPVRIAIVVDGEIVAEGLADIARPDLAEYGDGAHGFMIALPDSLQATRRHRMLALAGADKTPIVTAPSFWQEAKSSDGWSAVVFEPGQPSPEGWLSAKVPEPLASPDRRAVTVAGWLFDAREFESYPEPTPAELDAIVANLAAAGATCSAIGITYLPVLVPDKRRVVSVAPRAGRGWIAALASRLRDVDEVELIQLQPVLRQADRHGPPYHRTDTDWNDLGAFFVARALLKEAHKRVPALRPPALAELHLRPVSSYRGTLADAPKLELLDGELVPCETEVESEDGVVIDASALNALRMPVEQHLAEAGSNHLRIYANPEREEEARLAIVGDSASLPVVTWLAECTRRTTFFWTDALPLTQLELELPPIVFHLIREADLHSVPLPQLWPGQTAGVPDRDRHSPPYVGDGRSNGAYRNGAAVAARPATAGAGARAPIPAHEPLDVPAQSLTPIATVSRTAFEAIAFGTRKALSLTRSALRTHARTITLVAALTALSWPFVYITGGAGLDNSWVVGLSLAVSHGLSFGQQVVFTYGPLGFSLVPTAVTPGTFFAGELLGGLIQVALVAVLLANLRRRMNLFGASVLTLLAASIVGWLEAEPLTGIVFGLVTLAYTAPPTRRDEAFRRLAFAGGALVGFTLLVKLNSGVATGAILTTGLLGGDDRRRNLARAASSLLGALVILWLLVGEPLGALPDYLRNGYEVVDGYVESMGKAPGPNFQWQLLLVIGSAIVIAIGAWRALATQRPRRGVALAGAVLMVHYFVGREAFIRYGPGHVAFISLLGAIALMIPWSRAQRGTGIALAAMLAVAALASLNRPIVGLIDPLGDARTLARQAHEVLDPGTLIAEGRAHVNRDNAIPPGMAVSLRGHCVNAEPAEISAVWAHPGWRWCPLPVFQSYTAYTQHLDELNAATYASARHGPDRVLRQIDQAIDERNPIWESPKAALSMLCHFTEIEHSEEWQTLARVPDRCGKPYALATIHTSLRHTIQLPSPPENAVMVAAIDGLQVAGWERLETLITSAEPRYVTVNKNRELRFRVPPGVADDGLILWVPSYADYAAPFNLNMNPHTLRVAVGGHSSGAITVRLLAVPIR